MLPTLLAPHISAYTVPKACITYMSPRRGLRKLGEEVTLLFVGQPNAGIVHCEPEISFPPVTPVSIVSDVSSNLVSRRCKLDPVPNLRRSFQSGTQTGSDFADWSIACELGCVLLTSVKCILGTGNSTYG